MREVNKWAKKPAVRNTETKETPRSTEESIYRMEAIHKAKMAILDEVSAGKITGAEAAKRFAEVERM